MDTKKLSEDKKVFQIRNHEKGMFTKKKRKISSVNRYLQLYMYMQGEATHKP